MKLNLDIDMLLIIFSINVAFVSINTVRVMLTMKGYRLYASLLSMLDTFIYIVGLGLVMDNLDNPINIIVYAVGFGAGIYVGILIEDQIALGYSVVQAIVPDTSLNLVSELRELGFGITVSEGRGKDGIRQKIEVLTPRKYERELYDIINEIEPSAFVITYEPKYVKGGFWTKRVRNKELRQNMNENFWNFLLRNVKITLKFTKTLLSY